MLLGAMLNPPKFGGVCRRECIFDYYGYADVFKFELFASFTSSMHP